MFKPAPHHRSPWPHRVAVLQVCATFPLIWIGGLVTTYDAGMAVPDWPTTYGYNLFLYPWQTWIFGPWDVFIEHGHRLLGAAVGMITIGLVVAVLLRDPRRWMRAVAVAALAAVIAQGVLGGQRVLLNDGQLAMLHGCLGPTFFGFCTAIAVCTSRLWRDDRLAEHHPRAAGLYRLAGLTLVLVFVQLLIGAQLRHLPVSATPGTFRFLVLFHLALAGLVLVHVIALAWTVWRHFAACAALGRPVLALVLLTTLQLVLGAGTWVVKYSWPQWVADRPLTAAFTIRAEGLLQTVTVTAHVATGSLILAVATMVALRTVRLVRPMPAGATGQAMSVAGEWAA